MLLIADAGSTKVDWCSISREGDAKHFTSEGINALMLGEDELYNRFAMVVADATHVPNEIYFYGAGCVDDGVIRKVERAFRRALADRGHSPELVEVHTDLLGAARALCGTTPGLVSILGTGSNTCYYDGIAVADHVPSLGYIVGDEGSGVALGKRVINAVYKRLLPDTVRRDMEQFLGMDYGGILRRIYREPAANTFLASLVPFIREQIGLHPEVRGLVADEFREFFKRNIRAYGPLTSSVPLHFTGGVAAAFADVLTQTAAMLGIINIGSIVARPMQGLVEFHTKNLYI